MTKIYLSPSNQSGNAFCTGNTTEYAVWYEIAGLLEKLLKEYACEVKTAKASMRLKNRAEEALSWGADVYVAMHSNASAGHQLRGVEVWYDGNRSDAADCKKLAAAFLTQLSTIFKKIGLKTSSSFWDCYYPKMPSCIVECGFHDNAADARLILESKKKIAELYLAALVSYLGLKKAADSAAETATEAGAAYVYTVKKGDTLGKLAAKFSTTVNALAKANSIQNVDLILIGQKLIIPNARRYTVKRGDTLSKLARANGTTIRKLVRANGILNANLIITGQTLILV